MAKVRIVSLMLTALVVSSCTFAPLTHAQSNVASNNAQQVQEVMAEKPSNTVTTPTEPQQFGRDSVYATPAPEPQQPSIGRRSHRRRGWRSSPLRRAAHSSVGASDGGRK